MAVRRREYAMRGSPKVGTLVYRMSRLYALSHEKPCILPAIPRKLLGRIEPCAHLCARVRVA